MVANVEWATPKIEECWSYDGRLYRLERKARYLRDNHVEYAKYMIEHCGSLGRTENMEYWKKRLEVIPPIYKVRWSWEEADESTE